MANPNRLRIIYHPARRAISFFLYEDDKKIDARYESLEKYSVYEKGKFVLSLCGNSFFTDILKPFVGKDLVNISLRTTKIDYEDFKRRVCEYNATKSKNDCEIKLLPLDEGDELLDMKQSFYEIKGQGEKIVSLLNEHWKKIQDIHCTSANAKEYLMRVAEKIKIEKDSIEKNLKALSDDNNVNLCLIGVHSSGKSTLINTLLGYRILPVDIRPETAKMLKITGVDLLEDSYIKFSIGKQDDEKKCHIKWDKNSNSLCIKDSNLPQEQKNLVVDELKKNSDSQIHNQLYRLLDYLNRDESLNARIDLGFPIPFNSPDLKFTIYDTPGADSNVGYHKKILSEALANQTNSILLFVLHPNNLSGTGNVEIMKELLEKSKNSNNVIDIEQSFFVFNCADSYTADELDKLKDGKLKKSEMDENPVDLRDRKVFFVSAKCGFAAMATKNNVAGSDEKDTFEFDCNKSYRSSNGRYYKHNHFGKSEYATKLMIENTEVALQNAENANDDCMKYLISSGIFTLQEEIKNYGERYASAVKTSAIIKSIESAAESVTRMVKETSLGTDEKVKDIQTKLENEINKVGEIIDATSVEYARRSKTPSEIDKVGIGAQSFHYNVLTPVEEVLNKKLEKFLLLFNVHIDDQMQTAIQTEISDIYRKYTENYKEKRSRYLVRTQSEFINDFMEQVEKSEISKETKEKLKNFKLPDTPEFGLDKKIDELFDGAKLFEHENIKKFFKAIADGTSFASEKLDQSISKNEREKFKSAENEAGIPVVSSKKDKAIALVKSFAKKKGDTFKEGYEKTKKAIKPVINATANGAEWLRRKIGDWETRTVSKKQFITDVKDWFQKNQGKLTDKFVEDFSTAIDQMCKDLVDEFKGNIETYSTKIRALREDNEPLEILAADIVDLQQAVSIRKEELESKI